MKDIKEQCYDLRKKILDLGNEVRSLHDNEVFENEGGHLRNEMKANITLAYRHLEDARMRIGKVVQAYDGGTSCYPR